MRDFHCFKSGKSLEIEELHCIIKNVEAILKHIYFLILPYFSPKASFSTYGIAANFYTLIKLIALFNWMNYVIKYSKDFCSKKVVFKKAQMLAAVPLAVQRFFRKMQYLFIKMS